MPTVGEPLRQGLTLREWLVCALLVLSVSLGGLEDLSGISTLQREFIFLVLLVGAVLALPGGRLRTTPGRLTAVALFVVCVSASYLRFAADPIGAQNGRVLTALALALLVITVFSLCALLTPATERTRQRRLLCALFSPVLFVALNLALYIVGFHLPMAPSRFAANNGSAQLLGFLGIHVERAAFPLAPGLNGMGEAASLSFVICVRLASQRSRLIRPLAVVGIAMSLAVVLLTDSRGPLAYGLLALALAAAVPKLAQRAVATVPLLLPVSPAIVLFVVSHLGGLSESLNRTPGKGSFETASGRQQVWSIVGKFLGHFHVEDLIGYGAYGQVRAGVASEYAYLFAYREQPEFTSVHNIALQTILDTGYIGLALFLWFLIVAINSARVSFQGTRAAESGALLAALIALSMFGASEALPGLAGEYLLFALVVLGCGAIRVLRPATRG